MMRANGNDQQTQMLYCNSALFIFDLTLMNASVVCYFIFIGKIAYQSKWINYHFIKFVAISTTIASLTAFIASILYLIRAFNDWQKYSDQHNFNKRLGFIVIPTLLFTIGLLLIGRVNFIIATSFLKTSYLLLGKSTLGIDKVTHLMQLCIFGISSLALALEIFFILYLVLKQRYQGNNNRNLIQKTSFVLIFTIALTLISCPYIPTHMMSGFMVSLTLIGVGLCIQDIIKPNAGKILPSITVISSILMITAGILYCSHPTIVGGEHFAKIPFGLLITSLILFSIRFIIKGSQHVKEYSNEVQQIIQ